MSDHDTTRELEASKITKSTSILSTRILLNKLSHELLQLCVIHTSKFVKLNKILDPLFDLSVEV